MDTRTRRLNVSAVLKTVENTFTDDANCVRNVFIPIDTTKRFNVIKNYKKINHD